MFPIPLDDDIVLELLEPRHAEELYRVTDANRAHLREWLPWVDKTHSSADTQAFIKAMRKQLGDNGGFQTVIRYRGALAGVIGHHRVNWMNRSVSLGYWLAKEASGRGIMTTACRAYTRHAFETWHLNRVEIRCAVGNTKSRAIPERLGFRAEGTLRQAEWLYDHFLDMVVYAALGGEWHG